MSIGAMTMRKLPGLAAGTRGNPPAPDRRLVHSDEWGHRSLPEARKAPPTAEARERAENIAVALRQPHRRGSDDTRDGSALGRLCKSRRLGDHCWHAGNKYLEIIIEARNALGLPILGGSWGLDGGFQSLTDEQLQARKELALSRRDEADGWLREVMPRLPGAMERLTYQDLEPSIRDHDMLVNGLVRLAVNWGYLRTFHSEALDNPEKVE